MKDKSKSLNVMFAASECVPFAKTGGLADVVGSLPGELKRLGNEVSVCMPYYKHVKKSCPKAKDIGIELKVPLGERVVTGTVLRYDDKAGVRFYFIRNKEYYDRVQLYGTPEGDYKDNAERFVFFGKAILELINALKTPVDILHCHDWQTGIVPGLMRYGANGTSALQDTKTIFTVHNLAYQGLFPHEDLGLTGLPEETFTPEGLEFYGKISLIKSGMIYSDAITTVSKKYSKEIQSEEFGCGLEGVLANRSHNLYGILNGVDYDVWSPEKDKFIAKKFSVDDPSGKKECRRDLLNEFGLKIPAKVPIIGVISRLADQKGFDLIAEDIEKVLDMGVAFVLLGTGNVKYHEIFEKIAKNHPKRTGIRIAFNEKLAHKIEAGSDMFLMPSRYEPCGLNQMYSLKYGTIPIVRATGGLDDTIKSYNRRSRKGNGFKFTAYKHKALLSTIRHAVELYADKDHWRQIVKNAMSEDFSWAASAKEYFKLYKSILSN